MVELLIGEVALPSGNHQVRVSASHTLGADKLGIDLDFIRVKQISYDI